MPSVSQRIADKPGEGKPLLKGSDLPKKTKSIKIVIADVRVPPDTFSSLFVIDLKEKVFEKEAWAVNRTNAKQLAEMYGDNTDKWKGKTVTLVVARVNNPQTKKFVESLFVEGVGE